MSALTRTHGPALDEAGLALPFADLDGDEARPADAAPALETFDPESSDRWDGEELAWLDLERPAFEPETSMMETPWLASSEDEARWDAYDSFAHEGHERPDAYEFEGEDEADTSHGYGPPYSALPEREHEGSGERTVLEALLESEAGPGTSLADRVLGVAAFAMGPTLRRGSTGAGVATLQRALGALGHDVAVDGSFGPNTERALRAFQAKAGLEADGVAGPRTKAAIAAAVGGRAPEPAPAPAPARPAPRPTPPRPDEDVDAFAARLGTEWSRRERGKRPPELIRDRLRADYQDTVQGARLRWGNKVAEGDIRRAWMISREEEMRFQTERHSSVKPLVAFQPPAQRVSLVSHSSIGGSDVAPVAPIMVRFVAELRRRFPGATAANYRGHGGGSFNNRGYSLDLYIPGRDARGFYPQAAATQFLRAVDGAAKALGAQWRMIYNDFAVADAINRETGRNNVIFVGNVRRDRGNRVAGLNWHGPHPLILHFHLDLAPPADSPQGEREQTHGKGEDEMQRHAYEQGHRDEHAWRGEHDDGEAAWLREGASAQHAFERYLEHEQAGPGILDRVKAVAALAFGPDLRKGSSGIAVEALQRGLIALGAAIAADGAFGPATERAVRAFQSRFGLQADGVVGALTKAAIAAALGAGPPVAAPAPTPSGVKGRIARFIERYGPAARASQQAHGIPALFVLAQAALESGWGDRAPGFNLFGVKASASAPPSERQLLLTTEHHQDPNRHYPEVVSVTPMSNGWYEYKVRDWFRVYPDAVESFADHARVLKRPRYQAAFSYMHDPYKFAEEIVRGGYATGRDYLKVLTDVMRSVEAAGGP